MGDGVLRLIELARSAIEGDLDSPRVLLLPTAKNAGEGRGVLEGALAALFPVGPLLESFSNALILCEIPEPRLTFFAIGRDGCWLMRLRYAAEVDTDLVASVWVDGNP